MRKNIDILVTSGWAVTFEPGATPNVGTSIVATARKSGISTTRMGDNPKELVKELYADCVEYEPLLAAEWYRR